MQVGPAQVCAGLHVDLDALGHQQVDVAEQRTGVNVGLSRADLRLAQVELDVAEPRAERVLGRHTYHGPERLTSPDPTDPGGLGCDAPGGAGRPDAEQVEA